MGCTLPTPAVYNARTELLSTNLTAARGSAYRTAQMQGRVRVKPKLLTFGIVQANRTDLLQPRNLVPEGEADDAEDLYVDLRTERTIRHRCAKNRRDKYVDELLALRDESEVQDWLHCLRTPSGTPTLH